MSALRLVRDSEGWDEAPPTVDLLKAWSAFMAAAGQSPATIELRNPCMRTLMNSARVTDPRKLTREHVIDWLSRCKRNEPGSPTYMSAQAFSRWAAEFAHTDVPDLVAGLKRLPASIWWVPAYWCEVTTNRPQPHTRLGAVRHLLGKA